MPPDAFLPASSGKEAFPLRPAEGDPDANPTPGRITRLPAGGSPRRVGSLSFWVICMKPRSINGSKIGWVAFGILLGLGVFQCAESPSESGRASKEPPSAPSFVLPDVAGREVKFSQFEGNVVLLNFWATWCEPCRTEIPQLNELYEKYAKEGLAVIGISLDYGEPEVVRDFLKRKKISFVVLMGNQKVVEAYGRLPGLGSMRGIPTTYLIDRKGRVVRKFVGLTSKRRLEEAFRPLLGQTLP